jgi:hypothetical protein
VLTFTVRGVFIGVNGTSTDLERSVWHQVEVRRLSHMANRSAGWRGLHRLSPVTWPSPPSVDTCQPRLEPNLLKPWLAGRPTPGPTQPGVWPTWSTCQIHPNGDDDIDIWSTSLCHPLKCSNLLPKFLKSNKH